jgi:hypothetical protein
MGPGPYLYSFWGHSAIRVVDPVKGDLVYNFGSVDFSGNFFLRMVRGEVEAFVGVSSFPATARTYIAEDRTLTRRLLDLTPAQSSSIAKQLERYTRGGERHRYLYHHFKDNCVTRVADEIDRAIGGVLSKEARTKDSGVSWREEAVDQLARNGLWAVAVDLAIAGATDRNMTVWERTFLPKRFDELLDATRLDGRPLVKETIDVYRSKSIDENTEWTWPWIYVYLFMLAPICALISWRPRWGSRIFGLAIGTLGFCLTILWAATEYDFTEHNFNVLVLPATHFAFLFPRRRIVRGYALGHAVLLVLLGLLHAVGVIDQSIGPSIAFALPPAVLLALLLRADDVSLEPNGYRTPHQHP